MADTNKQLAKLSENVQELLQRVSYLERDSERVETLEGRMDQMSRELQQIRESLKLNRCEDCVRNSTPTRMSVAGQSMQLPKEHEMSYVNRVTPIDGMLIYG